MQVDDVFFCAHPDCLELVAVSGGLCSPCADRDPRAGCSCSACDSGRAVSANPGFGLGQQQGLSTPAVGPAVPRDDASLDTADAVFRLVVRLAAAVFLEVIERGLPPAGNGGDEAANQSSVVSAADGARPPECWPPEPWMPDTWPL